VNRDINPKGLYLRARNGKLSLLRLYARVNRS
jgi:adenylylsulfate kinase-like enzyme